MKSDMPSQSASSVSSPIAQGQPLPTGLLTWPGWFTHWSATSETPSSSESAVLRQLPSAQARTNTKYQYPHTSALAHIYPLNLSELSRVRSRLPHTFEPSTTTQKSRFRAGVLTRERRYSQRTNEAVFPIVDAPPSGFAMPHCCAPDRRQDRQDLLAPDGVHPQVREDRVRVALEGLQPRRRVLAVAPARPVRLERAPRRLPERGAAALRRSPRGFPPPRTRRRFSNAVSRASANPTTGNGPKPMSRRRPLTTIRWTHCLPPPGATRR